MKSKRILGFLLCSVMFLSVLSCVSIASNAIDESMTATLTIDYHHQDAVIYGADFDLYKVSSVSSYFNHKLDGDFEAVAAELSDLDSVEWDILANTLASHAQANSISSVMNGTTNDEGILVFDGLTPGLYLAVGHAVEIDRIKYTVKPFLVFLPMQDLETNDWMYFITIQPKSERELPTIEPVTRRVIKVWDDMGHLAIRPPQIQVTLLRNGEPYDKVFLSVSNHWEHIWYDLDGDAEWSISEDIVNPYIPSVELDGITFILTNRYPGRLPPPETEPKDTTAPEETTDPDETTLPNDTTIPHDTTGPNDTTAPVDTTEIPDDTIPKDSTNIPDTWNFPDDPTPRGNHDIPQTGLLWWPVPILVIAGLLFLMIGIIGRKREHND